MNSYPRVEGIGGWLVVLVLIVGVLVPIAQVGSAIGLWNNRDLLEAHFGEAWSLYWVSSLVIIVTRTLICLIVAGKLIGERTPSTPKFAIAGIWFALVALGILSLVALKIFNPAPVPLGSMVASLLWPTVICVVATGYLLRSERVANTYIRYSGASVPKST